MGYKSNKTLYILDWAINALYIYNSIETERSLRSGAEEEYCLREQSGGFY